MISLNECEPGPYQALMKIPLARTLDRVDILHRLKAAGEFPHKVIINRVMDGTAADHEFDRWGRARYPAFEITVSVRKDWNGQVAADTTLATPPDLPCKRWFDLSIMATGKTTICCMDGRGEWAIGDANTQHLLEIYNAPEQRRIRTQARSRLEVTACRTCTHL